MQACCDTGSIGMTHRHLNKRVYTFCNWIEVWGMHCCTLTNDGLHLSLWSLSSLCNNVFCVHKAPTPISEWNSLLPHNLIPHRCYDLGEWYFIAHGVEGSLYGLTNALEITYLVSRLPHTEFPSLFPINATMASWSTPSSFSILYWFCLQNCIVTMSVRAVYKNRVSPDQLMNHSFLSHTVYARRGITPGVEFRQKIYLSDGQVDLQNHLSVMKSTCPTQENHKIKRLFNVAP